MQFMTSLTTALNCHFRKARNIILFLWFQAGYGSNLFRRIFLQRFSRNSFFFCSISPRGLRIACKFFLYFHNSVLIKYSRCSPLFSRHIFCFGWFSLKLLQIWNKCSIAYTGESYTFFHLRINHTWVVVLHYNFCFYFNRWWSVEERSGEYRGYTIRTKCL